MLELSCIFLKEKYLLYIFLFPEIPMIIIQVHQHAHVRARTHTPKHTQITRTLFAYTNNIFRLCVYI